MIIEIVDDFPLPKQYWAVGSSFGGTNDQTSKFLHDDQWIEGKGSRSNPLLKPKLDQVQVGDILIMKSSSNKGPNRSISFTRVKAIGVVEGKENYFTFSVKWFDTDKFPRDFDGIWYAKTIETLRDDKLFAFVKDFLNGQTKNPAVSLPTNDDEDPDTILGIRRLEEKMNDKQPEVKQRISSIIERGTISIKVKRLNNFMCSVCTALGQSTNSFKKTNGETYIETHHVEPVSSKKLGVLSVTNLMTVCANHHRQMHYGNVEVIENTDNYFKFKIDDNEMVITKIRIEK